MLKNNDVRDDGFVFLGNQWRSPEGALRYRLCVSLGQIKRRAEQKGLPFDLDVEHLLEIFPQDGLCPALRTPLVFGNNKPGPTDNSPSVDRIKPELGYVKGNVRFLSKLANCIRQNATTDQIIAVGEYCKSLEKNLCH